MQLLLLIDLKKINQSDDPSINKICLDDSLNHNGQLKIIKSKVAIIGSGGIGCPLALYLAGAGVGTIGLFDSDTVDVTNLHRQIGHNNASVGMKKTQSLKNTLLAFNPHINIIQH